MVVIDTSGARKVQLYGAMKLWCILSGTFGKHLRSLRMQTWHAHGAYACDYITSERWISNTSCKLLASLQHPHHGIITLQV